MFLDEANFVIVKMLNEGYRTTIDKLFKFNILINIRASCNLLNSRIAYVILV